MRIVLIADTHLAAEAQAFGRNLDAATARIAQLQPALVIHLGDVTADGVKDPAQFAYAKARLAALAAPLLVMTSATARRAEASRSPRLTSPAWPPSAPPSAPTVGACESRAGCWSG